MLQRIYNLLMILAVGWSVLVTDYQSLVDHPSDRPILIFIILMPWLAILVFNYLIYGRISILLKHDRPEK
jgi:hypothetical protein